LAIGVVLLLVASHTIWDRREGNRLAALLDEIAARGEPVTLAELNPTLPPQEMNGYFDLLKAFEIIFADTPALRAMEDYPETIIPPLTNRERSLLRNLLAERYTIKKGDTLYSIARSRYGDGKQWSRIAQANPGIDPQKLAVGQVITIP
jgi:nucleoid-associated protein YgaU